jgi:HlyD family secretion protein
MVAEKQSLDERLKSLKIERGAPPRGDAGNKAPKKLLLGLSSLVVLVAAGVVYFSRGAHAVTVADVTEDTGSVSSGQTALTVSGYVVAAHKIAVGAKVFGRVKWIGVEKGDRVTSGQLLVQLEDQEYRAQVEQARANLAAAEARLDQLRAGSRPQEKLQGKAAILQAEANLRNAEIEYERIEKLNRSGVAAKADLDRATMQRDVARAQLETARQSSDLIDVGPRAEEIRASEAQVQQMRAALDYSLTQLASTRISAPVTGTILERIVEQGEMVAPSATGDSGARTSVVSLADLNDIQIELDISQTDFAKLKMGQRAEIIPEAYPDLRYTGFIAEIAPEANRAKATVQVKVKVENPNDQLRPEMNARVNFLASGEPTTATSSGRVLVPQSAVVRKDDNDFVFVVKGDKVEQRTIRRGDDAGSSCYVLDGLSAGERVVVSGADKLGDGDRITIAGS